MSRIRALVEIGGGVLLAAVVVVVLLEVVTRYLLQISISWPEEIARYLLVWLTFIGAAGAAGRQALIVVDTLTEVVPARVRRALDLVATMAGLIAVVFLIWAGLPLFGAPSRTESPGTGITLGWVYLALPVGGFLIVLMLVSDLARVWRGREPGSGNAGRPDQRGSPDPPNRPNHG